MKTYQVLISENHKDILPKIITDIVPFFAKISPPLKNSGPLHLKTALQYQNRNRN